MLQPLAMTTSPKDIASEIEQLAGLYQRGVLSKSEFEDAKQRVLGQPSSKPTEASSNVTHTPPAPDALALTAVEVYVLPHANFDALVDAHRGVAIAILKNLGSTLSHRLRVTITELQALRG
ncbi:MAG: SHOCT domain-containing protein [Rhodocyclaceae bacterium]|nr:SHOCT domain-containing protein [Rhodocyclaceae bacterium]